MSFDLTVRITAPHFVAGYDMTRGNIAPIIKYMRGWSLDKIAVYCARKGWTYEVLASKGRDLR